MNSATFPTHENDFLSLKVCVLIPTFNNAGTLKSVIDAVLQFTKQIIVINDGSTDNTQQILDDMDSVIKLQYAENKGKGHALQKGFELALQQGYEYAITIDSDGQHFAHDLPAFLEALKKSPQSLLIGARNMQQENVPGKSSFGNKFSNFWFWVETGYKLPDTQSGYRAYPLPPLQGMKFFSTKYEFEIEVPVRLAWKGIPVSCIPISVYYPPANERISHFRPFKDFSRISVLNTFLTFIALLWIHPRNFFKKLLNKEGRKKIWKEAVLRPEESVQRKASSIAFGVFMGIFPVWGFQLAIGIPLAIAFRLNKALFLLAANISIFPLTPIFWALSLMTGKFLLGYENWSFNTEHNTLTQFKEAGFSFFLGGAVLAILLGGLSYLVGFLILKQRLKINGK